MKEYEATNIHQQKRMALG